MKQKPLYQQLTEYEKKGYLPMHMPGHKRKGPDYLQALDSTLDITELPSFDHLYAPDGVLRDSMDDAARIFGSLACRYLAASTTAGILSGMYALYRPHATILMARNCHISVYHGAELLGAKTVYLSPEYDKKLGIYTALQPDEVERAFCEMPDISLVVLTSPTYEGVVSDVEEITRIAHKYSAAVLLDAAHGAHFGFCEGFPDNPLYGGADIVVESLHKTLPSLTGTAIAHINNQTCLKRFDHGLSMFQTSSPSYLLLASIDGCVHWLAENGKYSLYEWSRQLDSFRREAESFQFLKICSGSDFPESFSYDKGKLLLCAKNGSACGSWLYHSLRERFFIEPEMATSNSVLLMTSPMDADADYARLLDALLVLDAEGAHMEFPVWQVAAPINTSQCVSISEAMAMPKEEVPLTGALERICGEYVIVFPPDCPLLLPGERITQAHLQMLERYRKSGVSLQKSDSSDPEKITILLQPDGRK